MNGYGFTNAVRAALARARIEASQLGHDHVGPSHILLGLLFVADNDAMAVLRKFQIAPADVERELRYHLKRGDHVSAEGHDLPFTSRAKRVLDLALAAAGSMRHTYVGHVHVLLGIMADVRNTAAETLVDLGVTLEGARAEVQRLVGDDVVATGFEWLSELGAMTRQLSDSLSDVKSPRSAEDLLMVVVSDQCGARHLLEISGVDIGALQREILESAAGRGVRELLTAAKGEQKFLEDCALASHHLLLAYLALRPAHGYRSLSEHGVTHASVRALAERILG